jgi:hypothetical protein
MKYYSETLNKMFDSEKELLQAEDAEEVKKAAEQAHAKQLKETRKARAKAVDDAYKTYHDLLRDFVKDYGGYHTTYKADDCMVSDLIKFLWS